MQNLLSINNLSVVYDNVCVLNINNMNVNEGDIVGIIGQNGAGKTTLINCILGETRFNGNIIRKFDRDEIGVQFQTNSYNDLMKVNELISIVTGKRNVKKDMPDQLLKFEIMDLLNKKISSLSGGERQRLTLFLVLYLKPTVLFFDELTTGLDYEKRQKLLHVVREYSVGKTVFSVTHYFNELEGWANKLLILKRGTPVFWGTPEELTQKYPHYSLIKVAASFDKYLVVRKLIGYTN